MRGGGNRAAIIKNFERAAIIRTLKQHYLVDIAFILVYIGKQALLKKSLIILSNKHNVKFND